MAPRVPGFLGDWGGRGQTEEPSEEPLPQGQVILRNDVRQVSLVCGLVMFSLLCSLYLSLSKIYHETSLFGLFVQWNYGELLLDTVWYESENFLEVKICQSRQRFE